MKEEINYTSGLVWIVLETKKNDVLRLWNYLVNCMILNLPPL